MRLVSRALQVLFVVPPSCATVRCLLVVWPPVLEKVIINRAALAVVAIWTQGARGLRPAMLARWSLMLLLDSICMVKLKQWLLLRPAEQYSLLGSSC